MTATTVTHPSRIAANLPASRASLWLSVAAFAALLAAFSIYLVVTLSSNDASRPAAPATKSHHAGGQYNQVCVPAPSTRYC
jgi:hypothetical protein